MLQSTHEAPFLFVQTAPSRLPAGMFVSENEVPLHQFVTAAVAKTV